MFSPLSKALRRIPGRRGYSAVYPHVKGGRLVSAANERGNFHPLPWLSHSRAMHCMPVDLSFAAKRPSCAGIVRSRTKVMRPAWLAKIPPLACGQSAPFDKGVNLVVPGNRRRAFDKGVNPFLRRPTAGTIPRIRRTTPASAQALPSCAPPLHAPCCRPLHARRRTRHWRLLGAAGRRLPRHGCGR